MGETQIDPLVEAPQAPDLELYWGGTAARTSSRSRIWRRVDSNHVPADYETYESSGGSQKPLSAKEGARAPATLVSERIRNADAAVEGFREER
jgi:hypothetical protein